MREDATVLFICRGEFRLIKASLLLLQAFKKLLRTLKSNIKLVVVGDPLCKPRKGEKLSIKKKVLTPQKRLERIVLWLGHPDQMHNFYHIADLVIVPSQVEEAFCMVAVVAMAGKAFCQQKGGLANLR